MGRFFFPPVEALERGSMGGLFRGPLERLSRRGLADRWPRVRTNVEHIQETI